MAYAGSRAILTEVRRGAEVTQKARMKAFKRSRMVDRQQLPMHAGYAESGSCPQIARIAHRQNLGKCGDHRCSCQPRHHGRHSSHWSGYWLPNGQRAARFLVMPPDRVNKDCLLLVAASIELPLGILELELSKCALLGPQREEASTGCNCPA